MSTLSELLSFNDIRLNVVAGDLLAVRCDAIVNPSNTALWLGSGVSDAIRRRARPGLQRKLERMSPISHGRAVVTDAEGLANCHAIIHVAVLDSDSPDKLVRESTFNALMLANDLGFTSVAFPALGTGVGTLSPAVSARDMLLGVRDFLLAATAVSIRVVTFAAVDAPVYTTFDSSVSNMLRGNEPETFPVGARLLQRVALQPRHR